MQRVHSKSISIPILDTDSGEIRTVDFRKVCKNKDGITDCHNLMPLEDVQKGFKFCPFCGGKLR